MIRVTIWNECVQEKAFMAALAEPEKADPEFLAEARRFAEIHPEGMNATLSSIFSSEEDIQVATSCLQDPDCGLSEELLSRTDVLIYWAHVAHEQVSDEAAERVHRHVLLGMGFIPLHSAHPSKPVQLLLGTTGYLKWRDGDRCRLWQVKPGHPICEGIPEQVYLPQEEMYGEPFDIPNPDDVVFMSWFSGGEVFRSGCTFTRGRGRIFYFQPGHETNPSYLNPNVRRIILNAVRWAAPTTQIPPWECTHAVPAPEENV